MTVRIFENGVFRPQGAVQLPERAEVQLDFEQITKRPEVNLSPEGMEEIYAILSQRFEGDDPEVAAKHNEHQP